MAELSSREPGGDGQRAGYIALPLVSRTQHVRDQLEAAIDRGDYKPGDRLPSERELVELLGVSRVSVREAIRSLEAVGVVEVQHGRGCFVAATRSDRYASSFSRWLAVHRDEALELLKVRGALDELAAEGAAARAEAGDVARLRELSATFRAATIAGNGGGAAVLDELVACDVAFHGAVGEASGSPLLADLLHELHETLHESRQAMLAPVVRRELSAREHDAIVEAIAAGEPEAARAATATHIASVRSFLSRSLPTEENEDDH